MKTTKAISDDVKQWTCSQSQLARALGISRQRINQLIDEGIVIRDESSKTGAVMLLESLRNYYLSKRATGDGVNFWQERGLHERAKRELAELKLSKSRGELYEAATVEGVLVELLTNFRNKLLGIPAKYAAQLEGCKRAEIYALMTSALEEELTELSDGVDGSDFTEEIIAGDTSDGENQRE